MNNHRKFIAFAERSNFGKAIRLSLGTEDAFGQTFAAQPVVFTKHEAGEFAPACLELSPSDAQLLMDELWRVGLRPSEGSGSAGSLAATERHLEDMRRLAFALMPVPDHVLGRTQTQSLEEFMVPMGATR